ncbi:MAG: acyltransferase [Aquisalimonadaceae bacterium]
MTDNRTTIEIHKVLPADQLHDASASPLTRYRRKVLGEATALTFARYELSIMLVGNLAGAAGYLARRIFLRGLFRTFGSGVILGRGLAIRHPGRITLGERVAIDDHVLLDAGGAGADGITLGDEVIVSRNCVIQGKTGPVSVGNRSDIGCNTIVTSVSGVHIGAHTLIAGNCYIGGGRYITDRRDVPIMEQGTCSRGPVVMEDDVWVGANVIVLDGVRIGRGSIIGAGALVTRDVPEYSVAVGVPAKVVGTRA